MTDNRLPLDYKRQSSILSFIPMAESPQPRLDRLVQYRKLTEGRRTTENPSFNSEVYGPGVLWLAEAEQTAPVPSAPAPWFTVWPDPTEMQAFVARWLAEDGWDVTKPKVKDLLRSTVPAETGAAMDDEEAFTERAAAYIRDILIQMVPILPTKRPLRETRVPELRHIEGDRATGRARAGWMGANRYASDVDRNEAPRGDRSARLHTQQAPRCFCACMMLQV